MSKPVAVIVSGLPATGKTLVARRVAEALKLPLLGKDAIKERLFNTLGWQDAEWADKLDDATYALLYYVMELLCTANAAFVAESDFDPERGRASLLDLRQRCQLAFVQINCRAADRELLERFQERIASGRRHPGHHDQAKYEEYRHDVQTSGDEAVDLGGPFLVVDTTDIEAIDFEPLIASVRAAIDQVRQA